MFVVLFVLFGWCVRDVVGMYLFVVCCVSCVVCCWLCVAFCALCVVR